MAGLKPGPKPRTKAGKLDQRRRDRKGNGNDTRGLKPAK